MMKLACLRCKQRKIKCDRAVGTCHQCLLAQAECIYVERKKRPRLAQQRNDVSTLNRRLEYLENQLRNAEKESPNTSSPRRDVSIDPTTQSRSSASPASPEVLSSTEENGEASWIYRLASDTKKNFEKANTQQAHSSPADVPTTSTVDNAMCALTRALEDLAKLRIRDELRPKGLALDITPEKAKKGVQSFMGVLSDMVIPDIVAGALDLGILHVMPDVIDSPYMNIDPGMKVMYYNALFYGLRRLDGPGSPQAQVAYFKCLESVPAWLDKATGTSVDLHTAALTAWTAINNFDYQLSWKFHCKACYFIKAKGIDRLDTDPPPAIEEGASKQSFRFIYWHCLQTDVLFRALYGKPAALRYKPNAIEAPALFTPTNMQPSATQTILYNVWLRYTIITREMVDEIDARQAARSGGDGSLTDLIGSHCSKLESLIEEWDLEGRVQNPESSPAVSFLIADHIMNIYVSILGAKRRIRQAKGQVIDAVALRAARKVISLILSFNTQRPGYTEAGTAFVHFISFYPFCAVFSLYEYILACKDPDECEEDVKSLERIGIAVKEGCEVHADLRPLSNTIAALNAVSRSTQELRRKESSTPGFGEQMETLTPHTHTTSSRVCTPVPQPSQMPEMRGFHLPLSTFDGLQFQPSPSLNSSGPGYPMLQDLPMNMGEGFEPLGFVRALESEFMGKNWHEPWWDMNGDMTSNIDGDNGNPAMGGTINNGMTGYGPSASPSGPQFR